MSIGCVVEGKIKRVGAIVWRFVQRWGGDGKMNVERRFNIQKYFVANLFFRKLVSDTIWIFNTNS